MIHIKKILKKIRSLIYGILFYGNERNCPLCGHNYKKFGKGGVEKREDAQCMNCGSLERHRFLWLYLKEKFDINSKNDLSVLHFAPEKYFEQKLRRISKFYLTSDIEDNQVDVKIDIQNIPCRDNSFNLIICSHVLEHVVDDKKALKELLRILTPDGLALIIIPVERDETFEDPSIKNPDERLKIFGQRDHVRIYGEDFIERLTESGFSVSSYQPKDLFTKDEQIKFGIKIESDRLYVCKKI